MSNARFGLRTRSGQISDLIQGLRIVPPLLDDYPNAAAAYSLRKLRTAYTGSAIRVRRSSDNVEQDIGFDDGGNLDTYILSTFVGANNGFVTTWYDQSGNSQHATQSAAGQQPQIVSSGTIFTDVKPTISFNNTRLLLPNATYLNNQTDFFISTVTKATAAGGSVPTIFASYTDGGYKVGLLYDFTTAERFEVGGRRTSADSFTSAIDSTNALNQYSLVTGYLDYANGDAYIWRNNSAGVVNNSFLVGQMDNTTSPSSDNIGGIGNPQAYVGNMQEIIIYASDQSSNRTGIETNINNYYAIY